MISNVRHKLNRFSKIVTASLFLNHLLENLSSSNVVSRGHRNAHKTLIISQIQIDLIFRGQFLLRIRDIIYSLIFGTFSEKFIKINFSLYFIDLKSICPSKSFVRLCRHLFFSFIESVENSHDFSVFCRVR